MVFLVFLVFPMGIPRTPFSSIPQFEFPIFRPLRLSQIITAPADIR